VCAWSRHGMSPTEPLLELLAPFAALGDGWVFDGELIALDDHDRRPIQNFAAIGRAVFGRDGAAAARLHYVAFDPLAAECRRHPKLRWLRHAALPTDHFPADERLRPMSALSAASDTHARLVAAPCSSARAGATGRDEPTPGEPSKLAIRSPRTSWAG
jgi:hypothetical protein